MINVAKSENNEKNGKNSQTSNQTPLS